ncbi:MAG: outer rane family protein [Sphingomonas bacterium]|uniref:OmpH family outer membrane protein n=1 Tax=Sphingomonas bacterium TaxID=1895847 RepID=UPI0026297F6C|nr:OmpH family outer membrane protein [Sphingomonas bacterium]MDB5704109.1 outer rane family protein [Sphingomonas bacterium]
MKTYKKVLLATVLAAPGLMLAAGSAQAQAVAIADPEAAVANSKAFAAANTQIRAQYKVQLDQADARRAAIQKEIEPLAAQLDLNHDGTVSQEELQAGSQAKSPAFISWQQKQQAAQAELGKLEGPAARAQAYAVEQITGKLQAAVQSAIAKRGVTVLLRPAAVMFVQPTSDLTPVITTELDAAVPTVSITPPANWQPGQQQAAGAAAAAPAAGAPAAPVKKPQGR